MTIQNNGGQLTDASAVVRLALDNQTTEASATVSLSKGQTTSMTVTRPQGSGTARLTLLINGQAAASLDIQLGP